MTAFRERVHPWQYANRVRACLPYVTVLWIRSGEMTDPFEATFLQDYRSMKGTELV